MFYFNKKNFYFYILYKNIKYAINKDLKVLCSLGFDSNLINLLSLKLTNKNFIKIYHINHNKSLLDKINKKIFRNFIINLKLYGFIINLNKNIFINQGIESNLRYKRTKKLKNYYNFGENLDDNLEYFLIKIIKKKIINNKLFIIKNKPFKFLKKKKYKNLNFK